ncbi:MAG: META domain-containing protein [Bacteroidia bacterium]|nr:META domain-containing protein [Bacteroidia bacterium]
MRTLLCALLLGLWFNAASQNLNNTRWVLLSIDDLQSGISKDVGANAKATIHFECDTLYTGRFCNSFCGKIKFLSDNAIKMSKPVCTRMMCMGLDKYEKDMMLVFNTAVKLRVEDDKLFIFSSSNKRLTYKRDRGH